jgi:hypothetical protein
VSLDGRVHAAVIRGFLARGFAPSPAEIAGELSTSLESIEDSLRSLESAHGLVLHHGKTDVWIAHPFSSSPTGVWVACGERGWWAPCIWCAMGIAVLAGDECIIHARLGGESETTEIRVGAEVSPDLPVHFAHPPRDAWDNVVHWCASVLPFRTANDVPAWCTRHRFPEGRIIPASRVLTLARRWYGRHADDDWKKHTIAEAQRIFDEVGLEGEFFRLPEAEGTF